MLFVIVTHAFLKPVVRNRSTAHHRHPEIIRLHNTVLFSYEIVTSIISDLYLYGVGLQFLEDC